MLVGYVSNERYVALGDVLLEFRGPSGAVNVRSQASGAVHADLLPGPYEVVLSKDGFGSKRTIMQVRPGQPFQFRLLSDGLLGYAWPKCVRSGEKSEFRVHSTQPYKLELWRYGWEKEKIKVLGWFDEHGPRATMQITPDGDYSRIGAEWNKFGYTSPHHKQFVEGPARSGLYYFHASTAAGLTFSFPWVVAPKEPNSPIAILASDITWNAYNSFGGRSNYINPALLPATPTVNSRQDLARYTDPNNVNYDRIEYAPLSFERPESINHIDLQEKITDPIEGRAACHLAPAEWRLIGWLEREAFPYDLYGETQLHHGVLNLDKYRVLIISTHPEYWSREMYLRVKDWVFHRGGKLMYLGGNGLNCETEFVTPDTVIYRNNDERVLRADPKRWESRFGLRVESEANLLGVVFTDTGIMTGAPYRVADEKHWIYAGTNLKNGQSFGEKSLHMRCHGGASGHETDKISASSPKNVQLLAKGLNPDDGGAEIVYFDTASKGEVFSAGSIAWPASIVIDDNVSKITANVIRKFLQA